MKLQTALVVCGGGFQGLSLIKALRVVPTTQVLVLDIYEENVSRFFADACFQPPPLTDPEAFLEFTLRVCQEESVDAIFAATGMESQVLASQRAAFARQGATLFVSMLPVLQLAEDKLSFYRWLAERGVSCLPFFAEPADPAAQFPLIGKPRNGWGGRDIHHLRTKEDALAFDHDGTTRFVWQHALLDFDEYSIDCAVDVHGNLSPLAFRRRIRTLCGFAILAEPDAPDNVRNLAKACLLQLIPLGARGPLNLQILRQEEKCWVSDLNARAGTSMPLSLVTGYNPIAFLLNGDAGPARARRDGPKVRTLRYLEERYVPDLRLDDVLGVVFDLDDTLLDQKAWIVAKLEMTWIAAAHQLPPRQQFMALALQIVEEGNRALLFDALARELGWGESTRLAMIDRYRNAQPDRAPVYPDVMATLNQLRRRGYRLALLTDNPPVSQRQKLAASNLSALFDAVIFTGELGAEKPNPRAFEACSTALEIAAPRLAMVGDNLFRDIGGSLRAGYSHGFLLRRNGGFFNFSPPLALNIGMDLSRSSNIDGLNELLAHLPRAPSDATPCNPPAVHNF
jgi:HAD superfamily hydrolase (TIGR01549 family)